MQETSERDAAARSASPSLGLLLRVWFLLGLQSFGGGTATLALIHRELVEQRRWVSEEDFTRDWALSQIAPGINLFALTILIGRRLGGAGGICVCLLGLILPSVTIAILITASYARAQKMEVVRAAFGGIAPATIGLGLLTSCQMARPLLIASRREGRASLVASLILLAGSGLAVARWNVATFTVLLAAGIAGALFQWQQSKSTTPEESAAP